MRRSGRKSSGAVRIWVPGARPARRCRRLRADRKQSWLHPIPTSGNWSNVMSMTYVIGQPCVDIKDRACVDECPVDCIYEGARMLYIHPDECVDCGACEPVCPVEAIYYEDDVPEPRRPYIDENVKFFTDTLPGRPIPWDRREERRISVQSTAAP